MNDLGLRKPLRSERVEPWLGAAVPLATTTERLTPVAQPAVVKHREQAAVAGHAGVPIRPPQHTAQPGPLLWDGPVPAPPQGGLGRLQCLAPPLGARLAPHRNLPLSRLAADGREAENIDGRRCPLTTPLPSVGRKAPNPDQPRLLRMQLQIERAHTCPQFAPELFGVVPVFETDNEV